MQSPIMASFGRFGPLLGVVSVANNICKFLVYSSRNAEVLTFHELKLKQFSPNPGWIEYDPIDIWKCTQQCIETACQNLLILEINPQDIAALGVCTQRGTTLLWDKITGIPLHNAIGWADNRTSTTLKSILHNIKGNVNYLKSVCGLPLSTCFSSLKIKWLMQNLPSVNESIEGKRCLFGNLDSWIIWNLSGGVNSGIHVTDVTNANYTMLMNVQTLKWEPKLCEFFQIPMTILPEIRSNSETYGFVVDGALNGLPIASCMGDQPAALLGQLCTKVGQCVCSIDDSCFVLLNTGREIIDSNNGLLSSVAFKLGPNEHTIYALEGAVSNAGSTVTWLQDQLRINTEINQNGNVAEVLSNFLGESSMISSSSSTMLNSLNENGTTAKRSEIIFVPAFNGLYAPYWRYDARGIILGLNSHTTAENITQAAYESTGFQVHEILESFRKDTPTWHLSPKLIVGGEFAENNHFMQFMADIIGNALERPQTTSSSCLGTMIAAGITMKIICLDNARNMFTPPYDVFVPTTAPNRRELLYCRWNYAVKKCLNWNNFETYETDMELFRQRERDPNLPIRRSIPGSIFLTTSFILLILAKFLKNT
ncbi:glycerol kinase [Eupeodes corollae]|uniref:glycerol kinase n=1 Tax=Eupeodes corollae TaxID=290404 RepID=UPI002491C7B9|nr:glycerol kinase [Eupeodes corollae]